eukprot:14667807-Heterocapsa_arctica.AAC.1
MGTCSAVTLLPGAAAGLVLGSQGMSADSCPLRPWKNGWEKGRMRPRWSCVWRVPAAEVPVGALAGVLPGVLDRLHGLHLAVPPVEEGWVL